ncbi:MAG: HAMP domain-containing histidine kinase [Microbacteriaceae bacterium]|nr:HAMP domain-containing histidine kinase [Microbacteriaceae bacterium]MCL2793890.1 HAMP domain-containing histidine kinase [Microbacteriaceae bacterium]
MRTALRSLRWRIVLIAAALVAASSVAIGGVTLFALHSYLVGQLDSRLVSSAQRVDRIGGQQPPPGSRQVGGSTGSAGGTGTSGTTSNPTTGPDPGRYFLGVPGQAPQTVVVVLAGGTLRVDGFVDASGTRHQLSAGAQSTLTAVHATTPVTVDLGGSLGRYRVASSALPNGDRIVTGVPLGPVDSTTWRVAWVILGVIIAAIAAAAALGAAAIGRSLRPLGRVAATASAVTDVRLDRGDVRLSARVSDADLASTHEVGQVGGALNALLVHVGDALTAREASEQTMRRFVADASHELRTPLATVRAYAQLSTRDHPELPADLERNITRIDRESGRMGELVEQLLLLARLDAGAAPGIVPPMHEVNLSLVVAEAAGDARLAASDHDWHLDLDPEPVLVHGDESQLRRLVENLLANARRHTPAGTRVAIGLHAAGDRCTLTVADDGPGVPAELQPTVFARFARGDAARNRDAGSTGLGLAIVKAIAEAHGGTVALESAPGHTVFTVTLPR